MKEKANWKRAESMRSSLEYAEKYANSIGDSVRLFTLENMGKMPIRVGNSREIMRMNIRKKMYVSVKYARFRLEQRCNNRKEVPVCI